MSTVSSTAVSLLPSERSLGDVCLRHGITWLALFGSVATGEATPASDADVLVEFEPGRRVTYLDLERIAVELSPLFGHRPIDLAKPKQLHWAIRDRVLSEAIVLYGRR